MKGTDERMVDDLKAKGYQVYGPEERTSYVFFTDGKRIGYAQNSRLCGVTYSTVHRPDKHVGTGFSAETPEEALMHSPQWADEGMRKCVRKYADFEEFKAQNWQKLVQY